MEIQIREYFIIVGWALSIFLSFNSFKRSEIYRSKDKITDKLEKLHEWVIKEVKSLDLKKDIAELQLIENYLSSKLTQIELRIGQFNKYIGKEIVDASCVAQIRCVNLFSKASKIDLINEINNAFSDTLEHIESEFDAHNGKGVIKHFTCYLPEIAVMTYSLLASWAVIAILNQLF